MENVIVASYAKKESAHDAWQHLKDLQEIHDIIIYRKVLLKVLDGQEIKVLTDTDDPEEGWRTITGTAIGGLVGLLGGPIGVVIGATFGMLVGAYGEVQAFDISEEFVSELKKRANPGSYIIILDADEEEPVFLDSYLEKGAQNVVRMPVDKVYDEYIAKSEEEERNLVEQAEKEFKQALRRDDSEVDDQNRASLKTQASPELQEKMEYLEGLRKDTRYKLSQVENKIAKTPGNALEKWHRQKERFLPGSNSK